VFPLLRRTSAIGVALALSSTGAQAEEAGLCAAGYENTQVLRRAGRLVEARASAIQCSSQSCPEVLAKDCARWVADIEPAIPRVVLSVKDGSGAPLGGVSIYLDGKPVTGTASGQSIEVDPGEHVLRFEHPPEKPIEKRVLIVEGEKNHRVSVSFGDLRPTSSVGAPAVSPSASPLAAWLAASVSAVALVTSAVFGVRALQQRSELERARCKPRCNPNDVLALQRSAAFADIAGAAAVVAAGGAVYLFLSSSAVSTPQSSPPTARNGEAGFGIVWRRNFQ